MVIGRITDNCTEGHYISDLFPDIDGSSIDSFLTLANRSISELCDGNDLLVFPDSFTTYHDNINQETIFKSYDSKIFTGNILGFFGNGNVSLHIKSRFDLSEENYFLHYMLKKVLSINLFDLKTESNDLEIWSFLIYMFPLALHNAISKGLYKEYIFFDKNDDNIRGSIDISRHISTNIPFRGNVAYRVREYSLDNSVSQLVRHTIEYIKKFDWVVSLLSVSDEFRSDISTIVSITPTYNRSERQKVISKNLKPFVHPYYSAYQPLVKLCLQILRFEQISYGEMDNYIYGILFDGAWLWEEYLNSLLAPIGLSHPQNRLKQGKKYLYTNKSGEIYPDFYNNDVVLDAKYKKLDGSNLSREDRFQIISYIHCLKVNSGFVLYPVSSGSYNCIERRTLNGYGGVVGKIPFHIPTTSNSFEDYSKKIMEEEKSFVATISQIITEQSSINTIQIS